MGRGEENFDTAAPDFMMSLVGWKGMRRGRRESGGEGTKDGLGELEMIEWREKRKRARGIERGQDGRK